MCGRWQELRASGVAGYVAWGKQGEAATTCARMTLLHVAHSGSDLPNGSTDLATSTWGRNAHNRC